MAEKIADGLSQHPRLDSIQEALRIDIVGKESDVAQPAHHQRERSGFQNRGMPLP